MYNILTFDNGQPIILYKENDKVFMYVVSKGRIFPKGTLLNNVKSDFQVFKSSIFYISIDDKIKLVKLKNGRFTEMFSIPLNQDNKMIEKVSPVFLEDKLFLFYISHDLAQSTFSLQAFNYFSNNKKILLNNEKKPVQHLGAFVVDNEIFIVIKYTESTRIYQCDFEFNVMEYDILPELKKEVKNSDEKNKEQIHRLQLELENVLKQYNELSEYVEILQKDSNNSIYRCDNAPKII